MKIIECRDLVFSHDVENLFKKFSFDVRKGEKIALTGTSGRGKSTLLNLLVGFLPDFEGILELFGLQVNEHNIYRIRKKIAWLPQETSMVFETTQEALTGIFSFKENISKMPSQERVSAVLNDFELSEDLLKRKFSELSGGQRQRILLASTVLAEKPLVILDEPTSALDEKLKTKVTDLMLSQNSTVFASVHDPYWIGQSDRMIEL